MTSLPLDPRRTVVFAGDSVTDCGRRMEYGAILVPADVELNRLAGTVGAATLAHDGVHPTAAGHRAIAELWRRVVLED